jgi:hypothetical protein
MYVNFGVYTVILGGFPCVLSCRLCGYGSGHPKYVCVSWIMCVFTGEMISASVWLHLQNRKLNLLKLMAGAWECEKGCGERVRA